MDVPAHLILRPSGYYFRIVLPKNLREHYGRREIRRALGTASYYVAVQRAKLLWARLQIDFSGLRMAKESWRNDISEWVIEGLSVSSGKISIKKAVVEDAADQKNLEKFLRETAGLSPAAPAAQAPAAAASPSPRYAARLSVLIPKFTEEKRAAKVSVDQLTKYEAALELLAEIVGDKDINHITTENVNEVRDTLQKVPKHRKNTLLYRNKSLAQAIQIAAAHNKPRLDVSTVDYILQKIAGFFDWSRKRGHLAGVNLFEGSTILSRQQRLKKSDRTQFTPAQMATMFSAANYAKIRSPSLYWLPLLSAYTGARLGELAQLDVTDVLIIDNVWSIYINDDTPDKSLKSDSARRYLPIHSEILTLGILDYVADIRDGGYRKLFPNLKPSSKGLYSYTPSKAFAEYLDAIGIDGAGTVFHSFRHTVMDVLKQNDVGVELRCELAGQGHQNVNSEVYTNKARISLKSKALEKIKYDIDLSHLKYRPGMFSEYIAAALDKRQRRDEAAIKQLERQITKTLDEKKRRA